MKKLMIYYYVGGFTDSYESISHKEAREKDLLFVYNDNLYFRRHRSSQRLELVSVIFNESDKEKSELFQIILANRRTYLIWEETDND